MNPDKSNPMPARPADQAVTPDRDENPPPVPPITVRIDIGAEDWGYVVRQLEELAIQAAHRDTATFQMYGGGGGGNYSCSTTTRAVDAQTYRAELQAWSLRNREARANEERKSNAARPADQAVTTLKPCPFCGGEATCVFGRDDSSRIRTVVQCDRCYARSTMGMEAEAVAAWNRRADALTGSAPTKDIRVHTKALSAAVSMIFTNDPRLGEAALRELNAIERGEVWAAPGAVETPLENDLRSAAEEMRRAAETIRTTVQPIGESAYRDMLVAGNIHIASVMERAISALRASARSAPVDENVGVLKCKLRAAEGFFHDVRKVLKVERDDQIIDALETLRLEASASPSAERILTQATDVEAIKQIIEIGHAEHTPGWMTRTAHEILRKHFPARSGTAVVNMPSEHDLRKKILASWRNHDDEGGDALTAARACLAEFRRLNPAPSTASAKDQPK